MPRITELIGDIFSSPPNSVLVHACNCRGVWGSGVALEFKNRFPEAFEIYHEQCNTPPSPSHQRSLLGTALLIPPQKGGRSSPEEEGYWIACLFTSIGYGRSRSKPDVILDSTKRAMGDLEKKLMSLRARDLEIGELWVTRINSGKFGVQWDRTLKILYLCGLDLKVVRPEDGDEAKKTMRRNREKAGLDSTSKIKLPKVMSMSQANEDQNTDKEAIFKKEGKLADDRDVAKRKGVPQDNTGEKSSFTDDKPKRRKHKS